MMRFLVERIRLSRFPPAQLKLGRVHTVSQVRSGHTLAGSFLFLFTIFSLSTENLPILGVVGGKIDFHHGTGRDGWRRAGGYISVLSDIVRSVTVVWGILKKKKKIKGKEKKETIESRRQ